MQEDKLCQEHQIQNVVYLWYILANKEGFNLPRLHFANATSEHDCLSVFLPRLEMARH